MALQLRVENELVGTASIFIFCLFFGRRTPPNQTEPNRTSTYLALAPKLRWKSLGLSASQGQPLAEPKNPNFCGLTQGATFGSLSWFVLQFGVHTRPWAHGSWGNELTGGNRAGTTEKVGCLGLERAEARGHRASEGQHSCRNIAA